MSETCMWLSSGLTANLQRHLSYAHKVKKYCKYRSRSHSITTKGYVDGQAQGHKASRFRPLTLKHIVVVMSLLSWQWKPLYINFIYNGYQGRRQEFTEGVSSRLGLPWSGASARSAEFLGFHSAHFSDFEKRYNKPIPAWYARILQTLSNSKL